MGKREPIKAFGKEYHTVQEISGRLAALQYQNHRYGASDGRVSEQYGIYDALEQRAAMMGAKDPKHAVGHLLNMGAWLQSVDAPINHINVEMDVAVDRSNAHTKFGDFEARGPIHAEIASKSNVKHTDTSRFVMSELAIERACLRW